MCLTAPVFGLKVGPMSDQAVKQVEEGPASAGEQTDPALTRRSRGVRWEPDEGEWIGRLEARMFSGIGGARPSFGAAAREAVGWARVALGDDGGVARLSELETVARELAQHAREPELRRSMTPKELLALAIELGIAQLAYKAIPDDETPRGVTSPMPEAGGKP